MTEIKITIPEIHPSINTWKNWHFFRYNKEKKRWSDMIYLLTRKTPGIEGKAAITIDYYFKTKARHDIDNYAPKFLMDGLVNAGIIEDDHSEIVTSLTVKMLYDKTNPRTEIVISKVQA